MRSPRSVTEIGLKAAWHDERRGELRGSAAPSSGRGRGSRSIGSARRSRSRPRPLQKKESACVPGEHSQRARAAHACMRSLTAGRRTASCRREASRRARAPSRLRAALAPPDRGPASGARRAVRAPKASRRAQARSTRGIGGRAGMSGWLVERSMKGSMALRVRWRVLGWSIVARQNSAGEGR